MQTVNCYNPFMNVRDMLFHRQMVMKNYQWAVGRDVNGKNAIYGLINSVGWRDGYDVYDSLTQPQKDLLISRVYDTFLIPDLFVQFAQLEPTEEGILQWCREFGMLGIGDYSYTTLDGGQTYFEKIEDWDLEIHRMKKCLELWKAIKDLEAPDLDYIKDNIRRVENPPFSPCWRWNCISRYKVKYGYSLDNFYVERIYNDSDDIVLVANDFLANAIEESFNQTQLDKTPRTRFTFLKPKGTQKGSLSIKIESLIAALWIQFAQAVDGGSNWRICENPDCANWIEIKKTGSRKSRGDKKFCSNACRATVWRSKK
jgi:hypothetical protein